MKRPEDCRDDRQRRRDVRQHTDASGEPDLNGMDYLEVDETQRFLSVYFLGKAPDISRSNVRIDGGVRVRHIRVVDIHLCKVSDPRADDCMMVEVDRPGDFSVYTLRLVRADAQGRPGDEPLEGFDPFYAQLDFSFKAGCPSDLDCAPAEVCPPPPRQEPEINYLAKDYSSFRQLILDRLALVMPDWQERHIPDLGITLVELLAYTGDYLSYYQDAVATEAYLGTARQRISVRRHARLVDYQLHEGCNARAWVFVDTGADLTLSVGDIYFITGLKDVPALAGSILSDDDLRNLPHASYEVFEPLVGNREDSIRLYRAHSRISFYTWHNRECCLPRGATRATLLDQWEEDDANQQEDYPQAQTGPNPRQEPPGDQYQTGPEQEPKPRARARYEGPRSRYDAPRAGYEEARPKYDDARAGYSDDEPPPNADRPRRLKLRAGDVLIFEEVLGPRTGLEADADQSHRHAVRLTRVEQSVDSLYDWPVLEIEWALEDALPFPLCISTITRAPECSYLEDVSVARGNVILADHGRRVTPQESWPVPAIEEEDAGCEEEGEPIIQMLRAAPLKPVLRSTPLTYRAPFPQPEAVARQQSHLIAGLMDRVRRRVDQLWLKVRDGGALSADEIAELRTIFGAQALADAGLGPTGRKGRRLPDRDAQAPALVRLLAQEERLLAKKERRVGVLRDRAGAGYVLGKPEELEIAEMFGAQFATELGLESSQLLGPASLALQQDPRAALPDIFLTEESAPAAESDAHAPPAQQQEQQQKQPPPQASTVQASQRWIPQPDLLDSGGRDRHFVVEMDNEGRAHLRFGDGDTGRAPVPETILTASYRVGNGPGGNVGAEAISHLVLRRTRLSGISLSVRNPLPAGGGIRQEPLEEAKLFAPEAFRQSLERAITADDYALLAKNSSAKVQQAAAAPLRWNGSWYEVQVAVDPLGSEEADPDLLEEITGALYRYRRIGHDVSVRPATYVSLDLALIVCVSPHYLRGHVKAALLDLFSNRLLPDGIRGLFHPDNLTFGQGVYLSALLGAAQAVAGVESVKVSRLQRLYERPNGELENGLLPLTPLEVARLDNDPSFPERGKLVLDVRGGR